MHNQELLEKLRQIANAQVGGPMPPCLGEYNAWGEPLSAICKEAADEIERLQEAIRCLRLTR